MKTVEVKVGRVHNLESLTRIQISVLELMCKGRGATRAAEELGRQYAVVMKTRKDLFSIFDVKTEVELVWAAIRNEVVTVEMDGLVKLEAA